MLVKLVITALVTVALSGCFSQSKKQAVIVVEKSSNLENIQQDRFKLDSEPVKTQKKEKQANTKTLTKKAKSKTNSSAWSIPVNAKVIKTFSKDHQGLTFSTKPGQKVRAIRDGKVVYVGDKMKSHGKMIIIRHPLGFYSTYTQNKHLLVANGDDVTKGQLIASTSNAPFYFEMEKFKQPINPLKYLK